MSAFHSFAMVDCAGGNDTGPTPRKDAIWMGLVRDGIEARPIYFRNRALLEEALAELIEAETAAGRRLMIGFDMPFGYPQGFAAALTGADDPFAVWDWLAAHIEDSPKSNNRFEVAAGINRDLGAGKGPFWANGTRTDHDGLPRTRASYANPFPDRRVVETHARGSFTCWQLAGAGAVGSQVLMGLPVLHRLRTRFAGRVRVWPFEPLDAPVAFVEIWPSLLREAMARAEAGSDLPRDAVQVQTMARLLARLDAATLDRLLEVDAPEEGWIFGLGHEDLLTEILSAPLAPPPLRDDCFALPAGVNWTPVDEALALLETRLTPVTGTETRPATQALGRILAAPVTARRSNPPSPNAAVDGYGFAHAALPAGDPVLPLTPGRAAAGVPFGGTVPKGQALRILTGAALPRGVDTVVLEEDVTQGSNAIAFRAGIRPGSNTRRAGEDVTAGTPILSPGRVLSPGDIALLAATGASEVTLRKRLRVAVISTGDELVEAGDSAGPGQIYDANRPMLISLLDRLGHVPVDMGRISDDRRALRDALDRGAQMADAILTSGGASAGDEDHVSALLTETGAMTQWRIAVKPGRPLALALWQGAPVFGLPGNPVAALVCTLIFARPALGLLAGAGWQVPQGYDLPAGFEKSKKPGRREYLRARVRDGRAEVFGSEGSGRISGLSWAEGLVELPDGAVQVRVGDPVRYIPFDSFR